LTQVGGDGIVSDVKPGGEFSSSVVLPVLREACAYVGLDDDGAELIRLGENVIFGLKSAPVVVRIARSVRQEPRVERELCVARWLTESDVPGIRVLDGVDQPVVVDGYPVSFWRRVTGGEPEPVYADLAELLAEFHALGDCPCPLPAFEPFPMSRSRLAEATGIDPEDREFLVSRCAELAEEFSKLEFALPAGPVHGDAWIGNLLTDDGRVVLADFESAMVGPREWDLLPTAVAVERYGLAEEEYRAFAEAYGFDVRAWVGYPVLREIRQINMTTWIMQNTDQSPDIAAEFRLRVGSLRERDFDRPWNLF
jgi:Ser/Thr protein kinase RdoA (MazF antagonist)